MRARAKDEIRAQAIELRRQGLSYTQIAARLGVSKSSLSLWLRDVYLDDVAKERLAQRALTATARRAETARSLRRQRQRIAHEMARAEIGPLSAEQLHVAGVVAYWAEGAKDKPWRPDERVRFINSDPGLILLFLAWLRLVGVDRERLAFQVAIHERADIAAAHAYWSEVVGVDAAHFLPVTLKRHNPKTVRKNTGDDYHGCLVVSVRRSTELYRRLAGWWSGIVEGLPAPITTLGL